MADRAVILDSSTGQISHDIEIDWKHSAVFFHPACAIGSSDVTVDDQAVT